MVTVKDWSKKTEQTTQIIVGAAGWTATTTT